MNNINKLNKKEDKEKKENNKLCIEKFETAESSGKTLRELNINRDLYLAYQSSKEAGNDFINFYDLIDEEGCRRSYQMLP